MNIADESEPSTIRRVIKDQQLRLGIGGAKTPHDDQGEQNLRVERARMMARPKVLSQPKLVSTSNIATPLHRRIRLGQEGDGELVVTQCFPRGHGAEPLRSDRRRATTLFQHLPAALRVQRTRHSSALVQCASGSAGRVGDGSRTQSSSDSKPINTPADLP
jgi:hypothetical protein